MAYQSHLDAVLDAEVVQSPSKNMNKRDQNVAKHDSNVSEPDENVTEDDWIMSLDDDDQVSFREVADEIGVKSNTIYASWMKAYIFKAFEGVEMPEITQLSGANQSKTKLTGLGAKIVLNFAQTCYKDGKVSTSAFTKWKKEIQSSYRKLSKKERKDAIDLELSQPGSQLSTATLSYVETQSQTRMTDDFDSFSALTHQKMAYYQNLSNASLASKRSLLTRRMLDEKLGKFNQILDEKIMEREVDIQTDEYIASLEASL